MTTNPPTWRQRLWHLWLFSLCVGLLFAAIQSGCQADTSGQDGGTDATTQDSTSQDTTSQDTTTQDTAGGDSGGVLPKGSKCQPGDTCESGTMCCATCCGAPPPPDSGPRDPGYTCVDVDPQSKMCPAIP